LSLQLCSPQESQGSQSLFQCLSNPNVPGLSWTPSIKSEYFSNPNLLTLENTTPARFAFTYIFEIPAQGSGRDCTGNITAIQLCYRKPATNSQEGGSREIMQFLVMATQGAVARVRKSFPVAVNPQASTCSTALPQACCETVALPSDAQFELTASKLVFGLIVTKHDIQPLAFAPAVSDFHVDQYQFSLGIVPSSLPVTLSGVVSGQSLMLMRFEVGKESNILI